MNATVVEHGRSAKVIIFKKKRRKNYKRKRGIYSYLLHTCGLEFHTKFDVRIKC